MTETVDNVAWIEETAKAVTLARNAGEAQRQADLLAESKREFDRILSVFRQLQASATVVSGLNWEGRVPAPDLTRDLDEAMKTLDARPLKRVERDLDRLGREVAESLKKCWRDHAAQQLGDVADLLSLSETLSGVDGIAEVSQGLLEALGQLARSQDSLPTGQSVELLTKAVGLLGQLESSLQPEVVRRFLSAVARGGAPVESLTPDVTKWLTDHSSHDRFKIVAGTPARIADE